MSLATDIRQRLTLPAVCAPMFLVSGPDLVIEAAKSGVMACIPSPNARSFAEFEQWLVRISSELAEFVEANPHAPLGPVAVNLPRGLDSETLTAYLELCRRHGVEIFISAQGDPAELTRQVHNLGGYVFHDVTSMRFAEKAIKADVDGLTCIGAGGGGHSGLLSHLAFVPRVREIFDGVILMAGAISTGGGIRAAEVLGADLAYLGTRFIATRESMAAPEYKRMLVDDTATGLRYTGAVASVPANWLASSIVRVGLDPQDLPTPSVMHGYDHLPEDVRPWRDIWSAGQGIELIHDIPTVADLVADLRREYVAACAAPSLVTSARITSAPQPTH